MAGQVGATGLVVLSDINASMLQIGRDRLLDRGLLRNVRCGIANAERLPFADASFDCVTIGFGLRNVTDKPAALASMQRVLKPGGRLLVLEFSHPAARSLKALYDLYSFSVLPWLGRRVAGDEQSYRYLAESIRRFPDQETLRDMMTEAGSAGLPLSQPERRRGRAAQGLPVLGRAMLLEKLAASLNRNVAQSAKARALVEQLDGRSLSLTLEGTPLAFAMRVDGGQIQPVRRARRRRRPAVRARRSRSLSLVGARAEGTLRAGAVRISGDAEIAQKFRDLLRQAQPDVEEELARLVGDVTAHQIGSFARGLAAGDARPPIRFATSVAEYLQEEGRDVPTRIELDEFLHDVDRLRNDVERLEARVRAAGSRGAASS